MLAGLPGKAQRLPFFSGGLAFRDHFPLRIRRVAIIHGLFEHAASDRTQFEIRLDLQVGHLHQAQVLFVGQDFQGLCARTRAQ